MNCRTVHDRIRRGLAVATSASESRTLEEHLSRCARCRDLIEPEFIAGNEEPPGDLLESVLRLTSGPVCATARERLCGDLDGELDDVGAELLHAHADACADCGPLRAVLAHLACDLRGMRELAPDREFTGDVLALTSHGAARPLAARLGNVWNRLFQRPRIAWEAAYVGAMLFWLVLGAPVDALSGAPERILDALPEMTRSSSALSALRGNISELGAQAFGTAAEVCSSSLARIETGLADGTRKAQESVGGVRQQVAELGQAFRALDVGRGGSAVENLTREAREVVNKLVTANNEEQE